MTRKVSRLQVSVKLKLEIHKLILTEELRTGSQLRDTLLAKTWSEVTGDNIVIEFTGTGPCTCIKDN